MTTNKRRDEWIVLLRGDLYPAPLLYPTRQALEMFGDAEECFDRLPEYFYGE